MMMMTNNVKIRTLLTQHILSPRIFNEVYSSYGHYTNPRHRGGFRVERKIRGVQSLPRT